MGNESNKENVKICDYIRSNIKRPNDWVEQEYTSFSLTRAKIRKYIEQIIAKHENKSQLNEKKIQSIIEFFSLKGYKDLKSILGYLKKNNDSTVTIENLFKERSKGSSDEVIRIVVALFDIHFPTNFSANNVEINIKPAEELLKSYIRTNERLNDECQLESKKTSSSIKTIGVFDGSLLMTKPNLKQLSLYFDEFYVIDVEKWQELANLKDVDRSYLSKQNRKELDWLFNKGIIVPHTFPYEKEIVQVDEYKQDYLLLSKLLNGKAYSDLIERRSTDLGQRQLATFLHKYSILKARLQCTFLNRNFSNNAFPIIDNLDDLSEVLPDLPKAHVLNVLLKKIPIPKVETKWEQIYDYRKDPDSKEKYLRISNWLSKIARKEIHTKEIYQEIEHLLIEYKKHMDYHKMKYDESYLNTSVLMNFDAFQNLNKTKWDMKEKQSFLLKTRKIGLFEAESKAPGRELAYIVKAQEVFA
jgi:hypothetical protein